MSVRITCGDCGWASAACRSQAQADYALRQHSCAKERARQASARRGRAKRAAIDRTPKPCLHKIANHQHGTRACAVLDGCKCLPCAKANAAAERHRKRETAYGRWQPYVDAQPTREHVESLRAAGMGLKQVAKASGVAHGVLSKLIYGERGMAPSKRVRWETAVRLQVTRADLGNLAERNFVDGLGTRRRVQALVALGWSQSKLGARLGMAQGNLWRIMELGTPIRASTARAVSRLYDELWDSAPPATDQRERISVNRSLRHARERGWAPPMAWDEGAIDDPAAMPNVVGHDEGRVRAVLAGTLVDGDEDLELALTVADRVAVLRHCQEVLRLTVAEAALRTGISAQAFYADRNRRAAARHDELDEVAVLRLMAGTLRIPDRARSPERVEAIRRLAAAGLDDQAIAERIGMNTDDAVHRIRARAGIPAAVPSGRTA